MTKSFDPPNNDEKLIKTIDHDNANKGGFLNKLSAISNRNPFKKGSNDDYSDSNGKSKTFEVTRQSLSIMKSVSDDNDWMEQRRSVSLVDNHKAVNSFGSRNNSLQNNSSQSSDGSSPGRAIYIAYYLGATKMLSRVYCIIFIALVVFVYLVWLFAAWLGYPKDRGSLLVSFAAKYCGGRDNYLPYSNEGDESDGEGKKEITAVSPTPLNIKNVNNGNNDVDEDAEQDMRDREVVVMTIPKRRLAVVNV
nr:14786_t:CDS:2 [Entrophospora candida]